jgi:hypothetical protein
MSVTVTQELTQQTVTVTGNPVENNVTVTVSNARGPAGGSVIDAATQSDGTAALYLDSIRFEATNGGPTQLGEMAWESSDGSIDAMLESGVIVAMGEDLVIRVRNTTASPITKGTALAYDGTSGASGRIEVKPWVGANISTAKLFLGFAACDMPANSNGYSQWFGKLTEINTSGGAQTWLDEQIIYAVPGASATLTNIAPTSGEYAAAAVVINAGSGTSGILFVRPTFEVASSTSATANTLVLRDASGGASFGPLSALALSSNQHSISSSAGTNIVGPLALSGSTGDTLTATYNAAITLNSTTGVNVNGGPLTLTQTWTNAATTYTGLQVNVTDTASNAASLLMDLRVGGSSKMEVSKSGNIRVKSTSADGGPLGHAMGFDIGGSVWGFSNGGANSFRFGTLNNAYLYVTNAKQWRFAGTTNIGWSPGTPDGAADLLLVRDGASGTLAQRNGLNQQESRIYGTYTGAGDYRRLALKMSSAGVAQIVAEGGGSGASGNRIEIDGLRIGKGGGDVATNTALGASALNSNTTGSANTAVGSLALLSNTTGNFNAAVGSDALRFNTTGSNNSAVGYFSLRGNTTGSSNAAVGQDALRNNTTSSNNTAIGAQALLSHTSGNNNTAVGTGALFSITSGAQNTAIGTNAGRLIADDATANATSSDSVYLGHRTKALASNQTNQIVIGYNAIGLGSNTAVLGNDSIVTTALKGNVGIGTTSPTAMLDVDSDTVRVRTARTPASAAAAGNAGDICWDADYIYVCTATDTWKRAAISTW